MSIFPPNKRRDLFRKFAETMSFRVRVLVAMMVVVLAVTIATLYLAENNLRANQEKVFDIQFQNQVRSLVRAQETQSRAITERCRVASYSVRLRAALEESDVDDLYRNALTELQAVFDGTEPGRSLDPQSVRASFFRFVDQNGAVLPPGEHRAGSINQAILEESLATASHSLRDVEDQSVGFIAIARGSNPGVLREIVLTKIRDWVGGDLGALVLGFPISEIRAPEPTNENQIKSGIWLNNKLFIDRLSTPDRHLLEQRVAAAIKQKPAGNLPVNLATGPHLVFYKALDPDSQFAPAYDVCLYPLVASFREARILRWKILGFGLLVLACGFAASSFLARHLSKPVDRIVAKSAENVTLRRRAEKDLVHANRELEKTLAELRATQQQVIQQERLSALGQMAAGIAHDFNNTLMPILGFADVLLQNDALLEDKAEARRCLEMLRTSAKDAASVVSRLREFYRPAETDEAFPIVDLAKIVQQAVKLTEPKWRGLTQARGISVAVNTEIRAFPIVAGDESALREVLTNLLFNAVDAMPEGGHISIETSIENEHAVMRVADTGTGMTETVRQRCLEPFFSTKGEHGTGLGLSMVYGIVERHRGQVDIQSALGQGTTFIIRLPLAQEAPIHDTAKVAAEKPNSRLNVLIVDDEARSREVLSTYLRSDHHSVAIASSGREALEKFRRSQFDLVVMDRVMPEMTGDQTARFMKQVNQNVPVILLTGFGGALETIVGQPQAVDVVLNKPITLDALRRTIDRVLHAA